MKLLFSSTIAMILLAGSNTAAFASDFENHSRYRFDERTATVKFSDLDLSSPDDAKSLLNRVKDMASEVCARPGDIRQLSAKREQAACIENSYRKALVMINSRTGVDVEALAATPTAGRDILVSK